MEHANRQNEYTNVLPMYHIKYRLVVGIIYTDTVLPTVLLVLRSKTWNIFSQETHLKLLSIGEVFIFKPLKISYLNLIN